MLRQSVRVWAFISFHFADDTFVCIRETVMNGRGDIQSIFHYLKSMKYEMMYNILCCFKIMMHLRRWMCFLGVMFVGMHRVTCCSCYIEMNIGWLWNGSSWIMMKGNIFLFHFFSLFRYFGMSWVYDNSEVKIIELAFRVKYLPLNK